MTYVADLDRDFSRFKADFELVGKHLGNAQTKFGDADKRLSRFETKARARRRVRARRGIVRKRCPSRCSSSPARSTQPEAPALEPKQGADALDGVEGLRP